MNSIEFEYRPVIKKIYWALIAVLIIILLVLIRTNLAKLSAETYIFTTIKLFFSVIVPLSFLFRLHFFVRPNIFSKYKLENKDLYIKFKKKEKKVDLNNVEHLSFTLFSPRFFGGFKIKMEDGSVYRFLSLLQNNHEIVEFLSHVKSELTTASKFNKYIRTSKLVLVSWRRILLRLKKWPFLVIKFFILPGSFYLYTQNNISLANSRLFTEMEKMVLICLSFFVINFAISFFYNHFEEIALNHRTKEKSEKELMNWDFSSENLIFYTTQLIFFISSFFCLYAISKYLVNTL